MIGRRIKADRESFDKLFAERPPARILVEATTESEWAARHFASLGYEVVVADPNFAPMYATRDRRIKTDRRDARALCEACRLGAYAVGYDGGGNVTSLVNTGMNAVAASYDYDAFGVMLQAAGGGTFFNPQCNPKKQLTLKPMSTIVQTACPALDDLCQNLTLITHLRACCGRIRVAPRLSSQTNQLKAMRKSGGDFPSRQV